MLILTPLVIEGEETDNKMQAKKGNLKQNMSETNARRENHRTA